MQTLVASLFKYETRRLLFWNFATLMFFCIEQEIQGGLNLTFPQDERKWHLSAAMAVQSSFALSRL